MEKRTYLGLDLIRLIAATLVMMYHLTFWCWLPIRSQVHNFREDLLPIGHLFSSGWVGVHIFFVISGFVIAFSVSEKSAIAFLISRARRLYPAVWICATLSLPFVSEPHLISAYIRTIALSPVGPWISGVYWTLAIEITFYLLVALAIKMWGPRSISRLGIALGTYSSVFWWGHVIDPLIGGIMRPFFTLVEGLNGYLLLLHHGCYFGLGIMLCRGANFGWSPRTVLFSIFFGVSGALGIAGISRSIAQFLAVGSDVPNYLYPPAIWSIAVIAIVVSIICNANISSILFKQKNAVRFIGLITYPIYLIHENIGHAVMVFMHEIGAVNSLVVGVVVVLAVAVGVSLAEKRLHGLVDRESGAQIPAAQLP